MTPMSIDPRDLAQVTGGADEKGGALKDVLKLPFLSGAKLTPGKMPNVWPRFGAR